MLKGIIHGFTILGIYLILTFAWFQVNKYSRMRVYNNFENEILNIEFVPYNNPDNYKKIEVILPNEKSIVHLKKYNYEFWKVKCEIGDSLYEEDLNFIMYRQATNDTILLNAKGITVRIE